MKILFVTTAHNGLSQRAFIELTNLGHKVLVHIAGSELAMNEAVEVFKPQLILCPFLKQAIPEHIWKNNTCLIVHPGIKGDRGPSSLDWAIMNEYIEWGVTVLQASEEMDAGDIWSTCNFPMRNVGKSTLYRHEVTQAAMVAVIEAVKKAEDADFIPEKLDYSNEDVKGKLHQPVKLSDRKINWEDTTGNILKKMNAADSNPGVLDSIYGKPFYLFGAHKEDILKGNAGSIIAKRNNALCIGTGNGAIWITHLKNKNGGIKLPAAYALGDLINNIPEVSIDAFENHPSHTFQEIRYEEANQIGYLHFNFYNGAMSTDQCHQLRNAFIKAKQQNTKVIVLTGGHDIWSNGIHLNIIENSENPGDESWKNIVAINDLIKEILLTDSHLIISAMQGNAAAGGVMFALAADKVYARDGIVMNPHYKKMGLYGSEYWTYSLPKRVGSAKAEELTEQCMPLGVKTAKEIGLIDDYFGTNIQLFIEKVKEIAEDMAGREDFDQIISNKKQNRLNDENIKPLEEYRTEELKNMWDNFYGDNKTYHIERYYFVRKTTCAERPLIVNNIQEAMA